MLKIYLQINNNTKTLIAIFLLLFLLYALTIFLVIFKKFIGFLNEQKELHENYQSEILSHFKEAKMQEYNLNDTKTQGVGGVVTPPLNAENED